VAALMHAEELAGRPAVVRGNVDADNLGLRDGAAGAGVRGQVDGARAAEEAGVLRIQKERPDKISAASDDVRCDDKMALPVGA
jgi:hypothetical protein